MRARQIGFDSFLGAFILEEFQVRQRGNAFEPEVV
jgi:hypothetical protein